MDFNALKATALPVRFRLLVLKMKRDSQPAPAYVPSASNYTQGPLLSNTKVNFHDDLFLRTHGLDSFGPGTPVTEFWPRTVGGSYVGTGDDEKYMDPHIFMRSLVNKKNVRVYKDHTFVLSPPSLNVEHAASSTVTTYPNVPQYKCHKNIYLKLRHRKGVIYSNMSDEYSESPANQPENYDYRYTIVLFAAYVNREALNEPQTNTPISVPRNYHVNVSGMTLYTDP